MRARAPRDEGAPAAAVGGGTQRGARGGANAPRASQLGREPPLLAATAAREQAAARRRGAAAAAAAAPPPASATRRRRPTGAPPLAAGAPCARRGAPAARRRPQSQHHRRRGRQGERHPSARRVEAPPVPSAPVSGARVRLLRLPTTHPAACRPPDTPAGTCRARSRRWRRRPGPGARKRRTSSLLGPRAPPLTAPQRVAAPGASSRESYGCPRACGVCGRRERAGGRCGAVPALEGRRAQGTHSLSPPRVALPAPLAIHAQLNWAARPARVPHLARRGLERPEGRLRAAAAAGGGGGRRPLGRGDAAAVAAAAHRPRGDAGEQKERREEAPLLPGRSFRFVCPAASLSPSLLALARACHPRAPGGTTGGRAGARAAAAAAAAAAAVENAPARCAGVVAAAADATISHPLQNGAGGRRHEQAARRRPLQLR